MKDFRSFYKDLLMPVPMFPLYGLGELVCYGGFRYEVTSFEPDEKEGCWKYDLARVDGTAGKKSAILEPGLMKSYMTKRMETVEKPGTSIHSPKWDKCVEQVEGNAEGVNAYAVCTAMLGDESFKSMDDSSFAEKMQFYLEKLGIGSAGAVPNSLLADQDLEPETRKGMATMVRKTEAVQGTDLDSFSVWYYDKHGAQMCAVFGSIIDAEAFANIVDVAGYKNVKILKGQVEQTGKELVRVAAKAEDARPGQQDNLINRIKNIQIKRQKATIDARDTSEKSFNREWRGLNGKNINQKS
jgi:hypothetical protein